MVRISTFVDSSLVASLVTWCGIMVRISTFVDSSLVVSLVTWCEK